MKSIFTLIFSFIMSLCMAQAPAKVNPKDLPNATSIQNSGIVVLNQDSTGGTAINKSYGARMDSLKSYFGGTVGPTGPTGPSGADGITGVTGPTGGNGYWTQTDSTLYPTDTTTIKRVGIGTAYPKEILSILGKIRAVHYNGEDSAFIEISDSCRDSFNPSDMPTRGSSMGIAGPNGEARVNAHNDDVTKNKTVSVYSHTTNGMAAMVWDMDGTGGIGSLVMDTSGNMSQFQILPTLIDIEGYLKIADGSQGEGKNLTSDASGNATWQIPITSGATGSEPGSPYLGQFYMDTSLVKMKFWNGSAWAVITSTP